MNIKGILIIVLMILLSIVFSKYYVCHIRGFCEEEKVSYQDEKANDQKSAKASLAYTWGSLQPNIEPTFYNIIDSLLRTVGQENQIAIVGEYYDLENGNGSNIGYSRAISIKNSLADKYDTSRFIVKSCEFSKGDSTNSVFFEAIHFEITAKDIANAPLPVIPPIAEAPPIPSMNINVADNSPKQEYLNDSHVVTQELKGDAVIVNFASGNGGQMISKEMLKSLDKLANDLRLTKSEVLITGYAESVGNENVNLGLALKRADLLKQALIRKGIDENKIFIESLENRYLPMNRRSGNERKVIIKKI